MNIDIESLALIAKQAWEAVVAKGGRQAQFRPVMLVAEGDDLDIVQLEIEPGLETGDVVAQMAPQVVTPLTTWLCVTVDSYIGVGEAVARLRMDDGIRLSDLYAKGVPGVYDCLFVHAVDRSATNHHRALPYRVRGKRVHWLDVELPDSGTAQWAGRIPKALKAAMTQHSN